MCEEAAAMTTTTKAPRRHKAGKAHAHVTTTGGGDAHDAFVIEKGKGMRHMTTTKWWRHRVKKEHTYRARTKRKW